MRKWQLYLAWFLLLGSFVFLWYSGRFGIDLSDEGLSILGLVPEQSLGITFTHFYYPVRFFFPNGLNFELGRQLRLLLIILSWALLAWSILHSSVGRKLKDFRKEIILLLGVTTLVSLGTGIMVISYNALNQIIVSIYAALAIQYIDRRDAPYSFVTNSLNALLAFAIASDYLVRLPSFFLYLLLHIAFIIYLFRSSVKQLFFQLLVFSSSLLLGIVVLSMSMYPFSQVIEEVWLFGKYASEQSEHHGLKSVLQYIFEFGQHMAAILFAALAYHVTDNWLTTKFTKVWAKMGWMLLVLLVALVLTLYPYSISALPLFLLSIIFVRYLENHHAGILKMRYQEPLMTMLFFFGVAVASTVGSNVWIINLLLFYSSLLFIGMFYILEKHSYSYVRGFFWVLLLVAVLKLGFQQIVAPHRQGSILQTHYQYQIPGREKILLDKDMYAYVTEIKSVIDERGYQNAPIVAVSRLPGLVYLLGSTMPGSINFTDSYWKAFCDSYPETETQPVVIFRGNIPDEWYSCLAEKGVDWSKYEVVATITQGYRHFPMPTDILLPVKSTD